MGYTLTPVVIEIDRITSAIGSCSSDLIREIVNARTEEMLDIDALGESFDDFESHFIAEYAAYKTGDFSYSHQIVDRSDDTNADEDDDPKLGEIKVAFLNGDTSAAKDGLTAMMKDMFANGLGVDLDDHGDIEEPDVPRELSTGAALCDLILDRPRAPHFGYKYGYAFMMLCEHLGRTLDHDHWHSIDSSVFKTADKTLASIPFGDAGFSTQRLLVDRGAPCPVPASDDFPFVGHLTRHEVEQIDLSRLTSADSRRPAIQFHQTTSG
ncbi:MAG TPA: hypothetical protein DDW52_19670 [Planctomycetaceae bacterium]|nr:hypothetical protein [Planctomycetaceae bacterium]